MTKLKLKIKQKNIIIGVVLIAMAIVMVAIQLFSSWIMKKQMEESCQSAMTGLESLLADCKLDVIYAAKSLSENDMLKDAVVHNQKEVMTAVLDTMTGMGNVDQVAISLDDGNLIITSSDYEDNTDEYWKAVKAFYDKKEEAYLINIGDDKLAISASEPIMVNGEFRGLISTKCLLNNDRRLDMLKRSTGSEYSIFLGDLRISTTVLDDDNKRLTGQRIIDQNIVKTVIDENKTFVGEATIRGGRYISIYKPFVNSDGETIGMIYVGQNIENLKRMSDAIGIFILIISAVLIVLGIIFIFIAFKTKNEIE